MATGYEAPIDMSRCRAARGMDPPSRPFQRPPNNRLLEVFDPLPACFVLRHPTMRQQWSAGATILSDGRSS